jgi:hypothetical protein
MGAMIGELIFDIVAGISDATRESLAAAMRAAADKVERGDLVPEEAFKQAKKDQGRIDAIRERLRRNNDDG